MTEAQFLPTDAHLVVKRGHRGRFRFVLISGIERIGGEVHVEGSQDMDDVTIRSVAAQRIARLAGALIDSLGGVSNVEPNLTYAGKQTSAAAGRRGMQVGTGG